MQKENERPLCGEMLAGVRGARDTAGDTAAAAAGAGSGLIVFEY